MPDESRNNLAVTAQYADIATKQSCLETQTFALHDPERWKVLEGKVLMENLDSLLTSPPKQAA